MERWYGEEGALDIVYDEAHSRFDVLRGELVLFTNSEFVEVLRWCMTGQTNPTVRADAIDVSEPFEPEDELT